MRYDAVCNDVEHYAAKIAAKFTAVDRFVLSYVAGSPLAGLVSQANDEARGALVTDARNALAQYATNTELAFPIAAHLLSAKV